MKVGRLALSFPILVVALPLMVIAILLISLASLVADENYIQYLDVEP